MVNNQELSPLRSRYSLYSKTGHTRWDVTASWKVLLDTLPDGTVGYDQFEDLRKILAMFVAAPSSKSRTRISGKLNAEQDPGFLAGDRWPLPCANCAWTRSRTSWTACRPHSRYRSSITS